jgi:hypothetical protein
MSTWADDGRDVAKRLDQFVDRIRHCDRATDYQSQELELVRPYLSMMSRNQLFAVLTIGTSTVSGTVLVLDSTIRGAIDAAALGRVIIASLSRYFGAAGRGDQSCVKSSRFRETCVAARWCSDGRCNPNMVYVHFEGEPDERRLCRFDLPGRTSRVAANYG